jgi:hypothetical protein
MIVGFTHLREASRGVSGLEMLHIGIITLSVLISILSY